MPVDPNSTYIYHITDVTNLPSIIQAGGLFSDSSMKLAGATPTEIGYKNIKHRRMTEYKVKCCQNRFVGEFVPFYFCPRSPMLSTINRGNTGLEPGCQKTIVHLVSTVGKGMALGRQWAISDGNAGAAYTEFSNDPLELDRLNWEIINSNSWAGERMRIKASEFLVADHFPFTSFIGIGCFDSQVAAQVSALAAPQRTFPQVKVFRDWYY